MNRHLFEKDRRNSGRRTGTAGPLVFSNFKQSHYRLQHHGVMCNRSLCGACFQTNQKCMPGTILFIRNGPENRSGNRNPVTRMAEIRWCKALEGSVVADEKWTIGVRYL